MDKMKIGIVGAGGMAHERIQNAASRERTEVVGICATPLEKAKAVAEKFGVEYYTDSIEELLRKDLDAVTLSIPNSLHCSFALKAMRSRKHVLVEYPMAVTLQEADQMIEVSKQTERVLHVGLTGRYEPVHLALKNNLPEIGPVIATTGACWYGAGEGYWGQGGWYQKPELRGDTFSFLIHHLISQYMDLFGEVEWVDANLYERMLDDQKLKVSGGSITLGFKEGATAYITMGQGAVAPNVEPSIVGEEGYIQPLDNNRLLLVTRDGNKQEIPVEETSSAQVDFDNFAREISGEQDIAQLPGVARKVLVICMAGLRAAREKRRIDVGNMD